MGRLDLMRTKNIRFLHLFFFAYLGGPGGRSRNRTPYVNS